MADLIRTAQYLKVKIADNPGALAGMLAPLGEAGVNLLAVHAFPQSRRTQVDVLLEDPATFKNTVKPFKWKMQGQKMCFPVEGDDRPGWLANLTAQLSSAAMTSRTAGQARFGVILCGSSRGM